MPWSLSFGKKSRYTNKGMLADSATGFSVTDSFANAMSLHWSRDQTPVNAAINSSLGTGLYWDAAMPGNSPQDAGFTFTFSTTPESGVDPSSAWNNADLWGQVHYGLAIDHPDSNLQAVAEFVQDGIAQLEARLRIDFAPGATPEEITAEKSAIVQLMTPDPAGGVPGTLDTTWFDNLSFETRVPFTTTFLESVGGANVLTDWIHSGSSYDFYVRGYEAVLSNWSTEISLAQAGLEYVLPNFYSVYAEGVYGQTEEMSLINSLGGHFVPNIRNQLGAALGSQESGKNRYAKYFKKFANTLVSLNSLEIVTNQGATAIAGTEVFNSIRDKYRNYIFSNSSLSLFANEADKAEMFPMHTNIAFSTDGSTRFMDMICDIGIETELMKAMIPDDDGFGSPTSGYLYIPDPGYSVQAPILNFMAANQSKKFAIDTEEYFRAGPPEMPPNITHTFNVQDLKMVNIVDWVNSSLEVSSPELNPNVWPSKKAVVIRDNREVQDILGAPLDPVPAPPGAMQGNMPGQSESKKMQALVKISEFVKDKTRSLKRLFAGTPAYSEVAFYKITKYAADWVRESKRETSYYIPNSSKLDICHFVDTQVRYGQPYTYTITPYMVVVGSEYNYHNITNPLGPDGAAIEIGVNLRSKLVLIEGRSTIIPKSSLTVLDAPPMPPDVLVYPYRGISNEISMMVNATAGSRAMKPVKVTPGDEADIVQQKIVQGRRDNKIKFRWDDLPSGFEVFRTTTRPKSYMDFQGSLRTFLSPNGATSAGFTDTIEPNIKYYYTFRTVDVHAHKSNPSPIFEIEMVGNERGLPFLETRIIDVEEEYIDERSKTLFSKPMRRYIQILPTTPQGLLNTEQSNIPLSVTDADGNTTTTVEGVEKITLGVADESLWNKTFRIRFTSKKTGRKIDLDVNFTVENRLTES